MFNRCQKWVRKCGRSDLECESAKELNEHYFLCGDHFDDNQFTSAAKNRLSCEALPTIFAVCFVVLLHYYIY
jgi:hypothetical protein